MEHKQGELVSRISHDVQYLNSDRILAPPQMCKGHAHGCEMVAQAREFLIVLRLRAPSQPSRIVRRHWEVGENYGIPYLAFFQVLIDEFSKCCIIPTEQGSVFLQD